jgi:hypothetical protein
MHAPMEHHVSTGALDQHEIMVRHLIGHTLYLIVKLISRLAVTFSVYLLELNKYVVLGAIAWRAIQSVVL